MAREVTTDAEGLATGVAYVDTATGEDRHVRARDRGRSPRAPASRRGSCSTRAPAATRTASPTRAAAVGRYLTDTVGTSVGGFIPALADLPPHNDDGVGGHARLHPLVARQPHARLPARLPRRARRRARACPGYGFGGGIEQVQGGGYGKALKDDYRRYYGAFVGFAGRGEMIPNEKSYCEIDPEVVDRWGIPVLRFHWEWSESERAQVRHMRRTFAGIIEAMGGKVIERNRSLRSRTVAPTEDGHLDRRARSSTRWGRPGWGRARGPRSSTSGARRTTRGTSSWPTPGRS